MDAHHEQVARARAAADPTPRRYFAYSTILDRQATQVWQQQHGYTDFVLPAGVVAEALDLEVVFDFPSRFWGGRVAGLTDAPGASVFGVLFEIGGKDWAVIQHKEGAITNMCVERTVKLRDGSEATAFVTAPNRKNLEGPVSPRFVEAWLRGIGQSGLPSDYVRRIEGMAGR